MSLAQLSEITKFTEGLEIDKATKGILDFTWNFCRNSAHHSSALELRKKYNLKRTLGHAEINPAEIREFTDSLQKLLTEVKGEKIEKTTHEKSMLLEIKNLKKTFNHRSKSFEFGEVNLDIKRGDIVGVVGENGNGKTTFLRLIQEEILKDKGDINYHYNLANISAPEIYKRKNKTAFIPQRISKWRGTLMENLVFHASIHGAKGKENDQIVDYVISRMGLTAFKNLNWNQISSGYKLRFELAKMLLWQPEILILDEPLANLDIQATQNLLDDLRQFAESYSHPIGIILTSQQLHEVEQVASKILFLKNGKPLYAGSTLKYSAKVNKLSYEKSRSSSEILKQILELGAEITYFRDISDSTIQLFNQ